MTEEQVKQLTKRDYFAAMAMQGLLAAIPLTDRISFENLKWGSTLTNAVQYSVHMADMLVKELEAK